MKFFRNPLIASFVPFLLVIFLDQFTKSFVEQHLFSTREFGPLGLSIRHNQGVMLGLLKDTPELFRVTLLSTFGVFLTFLYFVVQYFVPIKSTLFRIGIGMFSAGILGNIIDRLTLGYVIDFAYFRFGAQNTVIFNAADALQIIGSLLVVYELLASDEIIWPVEERRGRKWIEPNFQFRYCFTLCSVGFAISAISGAFFYSFLRISLQDFSSGAELKTFIVCYVLVIAGILVSTVILAIQLSHKIAGPIYAFEKFLNGLLQGETKEFQLRGGDELPQLQAIADRFQESFHERLGIQMQPVEAGWLAPDFQGKDQEGKTIRLSDYQGKKLWLALYRYATCPVCLDHLTEVKLKFPELQNKGLNFLPVFECSPEQVFKHSLPATTNFLQSLHFSLVADPEKKIYRAYRSRASLLGLIGSEGVMRAMRSTRAGFRQGSIDGDLGRIPAHFLIDESGHVYAAYYGKNIGDNIPWSLVNQFLENTGRVHEK